MNKNNEGEKEPMKRAKTRDQRNRAFKDACLNAVVVLLWATVAVMMFRAWVEHPAEQPVSYEQHIAHIRSLGGDPDVLS